MRFLIFIVNKKMKLDKKTVLDLIERKVEKILVYFYDA